MINVAQYLLQLEKKNPSNTMGPYKIQLLCYYIQSYHLILKHEPLFKDDFEAWEMGPCNRQFWAVFDNQSFKQPNQTYRLNLLHEMPGNSDSLSSEHKQFIEAAHDTFYYETGFNLIDRIHKETQWMQVENNEIISKSSMENYYKENKQAMCDLLVMLAFTKQDSLAATIETAVTNYVRQCLQPMNFIDIYNTIIENTERINKKPFNYSKWSHQTQTESLICCIFMPKEFVKLTMDYISYYQIPSITKRLEICSVANNPLASYHLYMYMQSYVDTLKQDEDSLDEEQNMKLSSLIGFTQKLLDQAEQSSKDNESLFESGILLWLLMQRDEAVKVFQTHDSVESLNTLGDILHKPEYYQNVLQKDKGNVYAQVQLYQLDKKYSEAINLLKECSYDQCPDKDVLLYYLVVSHSEYENSQDLDRIQLLKSAADKLTDPTWLNIAAQNCLNKRKFDEAFELYEESAKRGVPYSYVEMGDIKKAERQEFYKKAKESGHLVSFGDSDEDYKQYKDLMLKRMLSIQNFVQNGF
jgi:uncharacterized phage-associated protein